MIKAKIKKVLDRFLKVTKFIKIDIKIKKKDEKKVKYILLIFKEF